jgi:hypothetical protein
MKLYPAIFVSNCISRCTFVYIYLIKTYGSILVQKLVLSTREKVDKQFMNTRVLAIGRLYIPL